MNPSPYGPPPPYGAPPPNAYPAPPAYYAPGPFSPPPPPRRSQTLAVASVIFAFVFAPLGAVLGHLSLSQIRRGVQRGRDIALVGLTLSYTFIVLSLAGVAVWAATAGSPGDVLVTERPDSFALPDPAHTAAPAAPDLSGVLLSRDELRQILDAPRLDVKEPSSDSGGGDAKAEPAECATAVAAGLNTVYDQSGATGYLRSGYSDTSTATMVDQVAVSFPTAAAARKFVADNASVWQGCAGKAFTITSSSSPGLTWDLGTAAVAGDRVSLQNTLKARQDLPQFRIMAAKGNVVIDLSVLAKKLDGEPAQIADQMLTRVPS